jgi:hypothetical protein
LLLRWYLAALIILPLLWSPNAYGFAFTFYADKSTAAAIGDRAGREMVLLRPVLNVTTADQTQSTTTVEPANTSGFQQMPLPPVGEPQPKSSGTNYLNIAAIAAVVAIVAVVLFLRFRRRKSTSVAKHHVSST